MRPSSSDALRATTSLIRRAASDDNHERMGHSMKSTRNLWNPLHDEAYIAEAGVVLAMILEPPNR